MSHLAVYLVRHEEAEPGYDIPDAHRALTAHGRDRMRATGKLVREKAEIDFVLTSPLVRAVQTAEILVGEIGLDAPVLARDIVAHPPSVEALISFIARIPAEVRGAAVVGHEPTLSELSATLLGLDQYPRPFKKGSVLALSLDRHTHQAKFKWLILGRGPTQIFDLAD